MKWKVIFWAFLCSVAVQSFAAEQPEKTQSQISTEKTVQDLKQPLFKPFIERYILDELKALRSDQQQLRVDVTAKVAEAKLEASDRAIRYTADTTNNIFYIITATASILVLLGWRSLKELSATIESVTEKKISALTSEYEERLEMLEKKLKNRSQQIIEAQEEISRTNHVHALWMRSGLERNTQEKLNIYDQILEIQPDDIEALTYKADALLDVGEIKWAMSLTDQALEKDADYSFALWQRACCNAELENLEEALDDIERAINLSESLRSEIEGESFFEKLKEHPRFIALQPQSSFRE